MSPEDPILKQAGLNIARKLAEKYRSIDALSRVPMGDCQQGLGLLTELFEHIDTQAAQIEALKEKLVEATAELMFLDASCPGGADGCDGLPTWEDLFEYVHNKVHESKEYYRNEARQQLKADPDLQKSGVEWG